MLREEDSPPCLELPAPWYLPTSHPTTLPEGLENSGGFAPWNCLCAVTSEQMRLLLVVQTPSVSLTGSRAHSWFCSWGKVIFMEGGWETPPVSCQQPQELALTCLIKLAPGQSPWKEKEAKSLGKIPGVLQSQGDALGLVLLELHGLGTAHAHASSPWQGVGWGRTGSARGSPGKSAWLDAG